MADNPSKKWVSRVVPYAKSNDRRAWFELGITAVPYISLWIIAALVPSLWMAIPFALAASLLLIRLFIVQHDCGHGAMFSSQKVNDWVGRILGVFTFTPYACWRQSHAKHHATSANLDRRGTGDVDMLTVKEYLAKSPRGRFGYRLYRHPLILFGAGSLYLFVLQYRWPEGGLGASRKHIRSAMGTNVGITCVAGVLIYFLGWQRYLLIQLIVTLIASGLGIWLFYVQHQFEETYWKRNGQWTHAEGSLTGSSYYDLPQPLQWFSGNIGIHHVHHLSSKVPFYVLPKILEDHPELKKMGRIGLKESFACTRLKLWDEENERMTTFTDAHDREKAAS